jgi:hypothetical protein
MGRSRLRTLFTLALLFAILGFIISNIQSRVDWSGINNFPPVQELRLARFYWATGQNERATTEYKSINNTGDWDGTIHLLAKVPCLSKQLKALSNKLDNGLVKCLKRLNWPRFDQCQSILEVQQVTPNELRHGTGYGAMFFAVYTVPVQVWPLESRTG